MMYTITAAARHARTHVEGVAGKGYGGVCEKI